MLNILRRRNILVFSMIIWNSVWAHLHPANNKKTTEKIKRNQKLFLHARCLSGCKNSWVNDIWGARVKRDKISYERCVSFKLSNMLKICLFPHELPECPNSNKFGTDITHSTILHHIFFWFFPILNYLLFIAGSIYTWVQNSCTHFSTLFFIKATIFYNVASRIQ